MDPELPEGWKRMEDESGQVFYLSRQPQVMITKRSQLVGYHSKGRYTEMSLETLHFGKRRRLNKYSSESRDLFEPPNSNLDSLESDQKVEEDFSWPINEERDLLSSPVVEASNHENDINYSEDIDASNSLVQEPLLRMDSSSMEEHIDLTKEKRCGEGNMSRDNGKKEAQLNSERLKLENAVARLTLNNDSKVIDHKTALIETAKVLNDRRRKLDHVDLADFNLESLKAKVETTKNYDELLMVLNANSLIQKSF